MIRPRLIRPRLLAVSLAAALVVGVVGGWVMHRLDDGGVDDAVVLAEPGVYQEPIDAHGQSEPVVEGERFPDVSLVDADGREVGSGSLVNGPLIVNVWFSTCPPCTRELVDFAEVHDDVSDRVRFVGVNPLDTADTMVSYATERGVAYELLRDLDGEFLDAIGLVSFPRTYFVDADGVILGEHGELDAEQLRRHVRDYFQMEDL